MSTDRPSTGAPKSDPEGAPEPETKTDATPRPAAAGAEKAELSSDGAATLPPATTVRSGVPAPAQLGARDKLLVEMGPLGAFFIGFFGHGRLAEPVDRLLGTSFFVGDGRELYLAVLFSLPAFAAAMLYSLYRTRRIAPMLLITGILVTVLGALTFIFQSKTFVYMKPTIIYSMVAVVLAGGLMTGRIFLKTLFDGALVMPDIAWRQFTWRFAGFNGVMAMANEALWRTLTASCTPDAACPGEGTWVTVKVFGFTAAYFLFIIANMPLLMKYMKGDEAS